MATNTHEHPASERLVSVGRIAREFDCSSSTVRRWIRQGQLPAVRLASGAIRVRREHIENFILEED